MKQKYALSNSAIKKLLENGACQLNGSIERFGSKSLQRGDSLDFKLIDLTKKNEMSLIYQDEDISCFFKPSGTLSQAQKYHLLVHRLDKGTSGALLMARNQRAKKALELLFKKREIKKTYIAVVKGSLKNSHGAIENKLKKISSFEGQSIFGSASSGKTAITYYKAFYENKGQTVVELQPRTGRTHQLRVHMAELGHPIIGDYHYSKAPLPIGCQNRLYLHAYHLTFKHPFTAANIQISSPLPEAFKYFKK